MQRHIIGRLFADKILSVLQDGERRTIEITEFAHRDYTDRETHEVVIELGPVRVVEFKPRTVVRKYSFRERMEILFKGKIAYWEGE